ncbi:MAG: D-alanyl-D-alanine carboxypeptidase/D-alanyl-D-alanine-endopeptidase [Deltaproteobacteria bacterium]|nr:D-alanyl-D-alanine carboxypeptidase/D-alanyl-D-alanine-endopeptidase [Deltaproteobacteria bacterium]
MRDVRLTSRPRARLLALFAALLALVSLSPIEAQSTNLATTLSTLVSEAGLGDQVSITVLDAVSGERVFAHQPDLQLNPASNQKLVTAAAALSILGAETRFRTGLYGRVEGGAVTGGLVLRGMGDPSLHQSDLVELARDLDRRGVRSVDEIIVDATYYDAQLLPPAFDQQPNEVAPFRAATGAISVDANAYVLRVRPGDTVGAPARIDVDGDGYFRLEGQITTSEGGAPNVIADQRVEGSQMRVGLRGSIPIGSAPLSYRRRVESPLAWSGHLLRDALGDVGIRVSGGVRIASAPSDAPLLAMHQSRPLAELVTALGKQSDNFVAEMLFRDLGAERHRPGRVEDSIAAVRAFLAEAHVEGQPAIVNGSGLFDGNRISSGQLGQILVHAYNTPAISSEYVAHLAIGGVDGTLERRLRDLPAPRIVRAKTGTLDDAIALSGYVLGPTPGRTYAFSVLVNGARGRQGAARQLADGVARALAEDLWQGR